MTNQMPPPVIAPPNSNTQPPPVISPPTPNTQQLALKQAEHQYKLAIVIENIPWLLFGWFIFVPGMLFLVVPLVLSMAVFEFCSYLLRRNARALVESAGVDFWKWDKPWAGRRGLYGIIIMAIVLISAWHIGDFEAIMLAAYGQ